MWFSKIINQDWAGLSYSGSHVAAAVLRKKSESRPLLISAVVEAIDLKIDTLPKRLFKQTSVKKSPCNLVLGVDQYQVYQVDKPNVPQDEVNAALRWKVKDLINYSVDDLEYDGIDLPLDPANPNRSASMFAVCAERTQLTHTTNQFIQAGFKVKCVDAQVMAQRNIAKYLEEESRALATISFMPKGCLITFTAHGDLYHTRFIDLDKNFMLEPESGSFAENLEKLTLEIQRSLDGFDRQFSFLTVSRLAIGPFNTRMPVVEHLSSQLSISIEPFDIEDIVDVSDKIDISHPNEQALLLPALGGALREGGA